MITVGDAKRIAQDWVEAEVPKIPNFRWAVLDGSIIWKKDDDPLPPTSDLDIKILVNTGDPELLNEHGLIQQKRAYRGIILETTFSPYQDFYSPEQILADFAWATHFSVPNILSDPSGQLAKIQKTVAEQFAQKKWVIKRIEGARVFAIGFIDSLQSGTSVDRMIALLFALGGGIAQILIQADLRSPTVRKAGIVFLEIMDNRGRHDLHESMLKIYGSQSMDRMDVERHLQDLSNTFDRALEIIQSPSLADYMNPIARPLVIDGSWEMINDGFHREAMNWIINMRTICQQSILQDASEEEQIMYVEKYQKLLAELGLRSEDDFQKRAENSLQLLDEVMGVAEQMIETNQKII